MNSGDKKYWDTIYHTKSEKEMSWFQAYPKVSMDLVNRFQVPLTANIIDVGGGDGVFAESLLDKGFQNIWVLDISSNAIERAKKRLGERASKIHWVVSDITEFSPGISFDFWHDRAAFHFLTTEEKIQKYVSIAEEAIKKDGYVVIGTFSEKGPEKCSGLKIRQYSETSLSTSFEKGFTRIICFEEQHITPVNKVQDFIFCSFKKK